MNLLPGASFRIQPCVLIVIAVFFLAVSAAADTSDDCGCRYDSATITYENHTIYFRNNCSQSVWIAANMGPNGPPFVKDGVPQGRGCTGCSCSGASTDGWQENLTCCPSLICANQSCPNSSCSQGVDLPNGGGFEVPPGMQVNYTVQADPEYGGNAALFPRFGCTLDPDGVHLDCDTGTCYVQGEPGTPPAGILKCGGVPPNGPPDQSPQLPTTKMEIFFAPTGWDQGDCDYYDVSLADGYNIPVQIEPVPGTYWTGGTANNWCIRAGGTVDLLEKIQELQYQDLAEKMLVLKNNRPVAIFSSCWYETHVNKTGPGRIIDNITYDQGEQIWNLSCCKGNCDTEATCPINDLPPDHQTSQFFSTFYDHTYTYQYGDDQANIPCKGEKSSGQLTSYLITFCGGRILTPPTIGDLSAEVVDPADPLTIRFTADVESGTSLDYSWDVETDGIEDYTGTAPVHSYDTPGAYRVTLTVTDESGLSAQTEETFLISDYSIPILPGWNFISVPKSPDLGHANASTLFAPVSSAIRVILTYDVATGQWAIMGADTPVIPLQGFWLRSEANVSLPLLFDLDPAQLPPSLHLYPGWNAIGHGDVGPLAARLALQAVKENWSVLIPFNATEQRYEISIINGANGTHSDDREMEPGQGYWLFMAGEGELTAP